MGVCGAAGVSSPSILLTRRVLRKNVLIHSVSRVAPLPSWQSSDIPEVFDIRIAPGKKNCLASEA
jgi:hypothetical protein